MPRQTTAPRFLRLPEVLQITGMGKTFIYDRINDGTSPKQIHLGSRTVVWNEQEVTKWMEDRMASRCPRRMGGLNTNRTLHRQGTDRCSAFFCALRNLSDCARREMLQTDFRREMGCSESFASGRGRPQSPGGVRGGVFPLRGGVLLRWHLQTVV